jgi:Zn-dependent peptidase ImmA (M78 family)
MHELVHYWSSKGDEVDDDDDEDENDDDDLTITDS